MAILQGPERDRAVIRGTALKIIRTILDKPLFDKMKKKEVRRDWLAPPSLSSFQHLEPIGFGLQTDDRWIFHPDDCAPDLVWPLSVGFAMDEAGEDGELAMSYWRTVQPKEARGYANRFGPFMVRCDHAQMERGQLMTAAGLYVWLGGKWTDAQNRPLWEGRDSDHAIPLRGELTAKDREQPRLATAIALRQRYEWAVSLGLEHSPSVRFKTDPTGVKDIFRIRDLPDGRDRREALMTWVTDHWRQDRSDPELEIYVRRHLRGATKFSWRGMNCTLLPSQFDLDQRDKAAAERLALKASGEARRQRETNLSR